MSALFARGHLTAGAALKSPVVATLVGTAVLLVVGEVLTPGFASPAQLVSQFTIAAILAFVAAGQGFAILAGREGIDLSVGSAMSLAALMAGNAMAGTDSQIVAGLVAALSAGAAVGMMNGLGIALLGLPPLVMTLGTAGVVTGLLVVLSQGRSSGAAAPSLGEFVTQPLLFGLPGSVCVWILLLVLINGFLFYSRLGLSILAIGANERAAMIAGVRTTITRVTAYMLSGLCAGFAGFMLLGYTGTVFVGAGEEYVLPSVIAVVLGGTLLSGGRGNFFGTSAGAIFLTMLSSFLITLGLSPAERQIVFGVTLIAFLAAYLSRLSTR